MILDITSCNNKIIVNRTIMEEYIIILFNNKITLICNSFEIICLISWLHEMRINFYSLVTMDSSKIQYLTKISSRHIFDSTSFQISHLNKISFVLVI